MFTGCGHGYRHYFSKNRHYSFSKSAIRRPFGWNWHPAGSKKSSNSTNCGHDLRLDRVVLCRKKKNPCFGREGMTIKSTQMEKMPKESSTLGSRFSTDGHRRRFWVSVGQMSDNPFVRGAVKSLGDSSTFPDCTLRRWDGSGDCPTT